MNNKAPIHLISNAKYIEGNDQVRAEKCLAKIQEISNQFDCDIIPQVTIIPGRIDAQIIVVARPRQLTGQN